MIPLKIPAEQLAKFYLARAGMQNGKSTYFRLQEMAKDVAIASDAAVNNPTKEVVNKQKETPVRMERGRDRVLRER